MSLFNILFYEETAYISISVLFLIIALIIFIFNWVGTISVKDDKRIYFTAIIISLIVMFLLKSFHTNFKERITISNKKVFFDNIEIHSDYNQTYIMNENNDVFIFLLMKKNDNKCILLKNKYNVDDYFKEIHQDLDLFPVVIYTEATIHSECDSRYNISSITLDFKKALKLKKENIFKYIPVNRVDKF